MADLESEKAFKRREMRGKYRYEIVRMNSMKDKLVKMSGGKCVVCGYNRCNKALEFHHKNKDEKEFNISKYRKISDDLLNEIKKCVLLCSNCHREIHAGVLFDIWKGR